MSIPTLAALAGQPNSGKSTIFNMLTGARQHVANYPGVTVEKKTGHFSLYGSKVELVDLPGTYSLTSYSLEERVARDFVLREHPDVIINVADAANLKRNLYLTLQLLEMETPLVLALNMMDVAARRGMRVDVGGLSACLGLPVVPTIGKKRNGLDALKQSLAQTPSTSERYLVDYKTLQPFIFRLEARLTQEQALADMPLRWLAIKLLEGDGEADSLIQALGMAEILGFVSSLKLMFEQEHGLSPARHIAFSRHRAAADIAARFVAQPSEKKATLSDRADHYVCHKFFGPLILLAVLMLLYQVAIVFGNDLAARVWPLWGGAQNWLAGFLPDAEFMQDPLLRSLGLWVMKSLAAILNYLPIFFLLFSLIAILEDSGYMPRMAFILDRVFRRFGLHGQSTLPLILGGVYVGGCAIPAVMSTKAIPDEKARLATILITPMMNCLAKVPLYLLLISVYFTEHSGMAMFFVATVTLFMALPVAKALSLTLLRGKVSAPFIMEMPPYHLPTLRGVLSRAFERVLVFIKKIVTVVLAVAVIIFMLINFPGLDEQRLESYTAKADESMGNFMLAVEKTPLAGQLARDDLLALVLFEEALKDAKRGISDQAAAAAIDAGFEADNAMFFAVVRGSGDAGRALRAPLRQLVNTRKQLRRELREETFEHSLLGRLGKAIEPVTQYAGFNWKINIALLSAFAAKENSAATLGAIYGIDDADTALEAMQADALEFGPLHALALMLFMALYPPCVPASVMVRLQAGSSGWMLFSIFYQTCLGLGVAVLVFSGGSALGLSGWQAMWCFYALCVAATVVMGLMPARNPARAGQDLTSATAT